MKKATELPNKMAGLIRPPLTDKQKRRNKRARDRYHRNKHRTEKTTDQNQSLPTKRRQVKSH